MPSYGVVYFGGRELNFIIANGQKYFDAQDIAACLGYVQAVSKRKYTGWQWWLRKEMPDAFKQSVTPREGRTIYYYSVSGVLWLEKRITGKRRRKINRVLHAEFYDWFYRTFPQEVRLAKEASI